MEELGRTSRLALAALICCTASTGYAADPPASESTQAPTFRSLLAEGWSGSQSVSPTKSPIATSQLATSQEAKAPVASKPVPAESDGKALIVRPRLRVLQVPASELIRIEQPEQIVQSIKAADGKPESAAQKKDAAQSEQSVVKQREKAAETSVPTSLAELIHRHTRPLQVPVLTKDPDAFQVEFAPSVNRLGVEQQIAANAKRHREQSAANVHVAKPINAQSQIAQSQIAQLKAAQLKAAQSQIAKSKIAQPQISDSKIAQPAIAQRKIAEPQITEVADIEAEPIVSAIAKIVPENAKSEQLSSDAPATAVIAMSAPVEAPLGEAEEPIKSAPKALIEVPPPSIEAEVAAAAPLDRSRRIAIDNGSVLLPLESFRSDSEVELGSEPDESSLTVTIHSARLRELARESLQNSSHRMQRQATHSAKKYALEALRSIVAMRDAEAGGNQHAKQLDVALDAIRESDDFCGRFGVVDPIAMKRMVAVHETDVLKGRDLENVSSLEATETYLAVAKKNLIAAAGGVREASDALVLLGRIEKQMSKPSDTHAAAVAVTLQRAAIEVAPTNGPGHCELGTTLLDQGLVKEAAWALSRSIELQPTRSGYQGLLEASRRLGDVETARHCLASLRDPAMLSETPVKTLSPEVFAATYKPNLNELKTATAAPQPPAPRPPVADAPNAEPTRISLRTLFPFNRR